MVPSSWEVTKFDCLFSVKSGFGFKYAEYSKTGIPLVKIDNVSHGFVKWDNISYLPNSYCESYSDIVLKENDILLALNRPITQGKLKLVKLTDKDVPSILYQRVGRIDFKSDDLDKNFYYYYLNSAIFEFVSRKSIGSDQPFISITELKKVKITKPPLSEQQKIAKILTIWDKAINTTGRLIDNCKQQKKWLMQQLLTGQKRLLDDSGQRYSRDWEEHQLVNLASKGKNNFTDGDWVESIHIKEDGCRLIQTGNIGVGLFKNKNKKYISNDSFKELNCTEVHVGDLLICRLAEPAGRACIVPDLDESKMLTSVDVIIMRVNKDLVDAKYLSYYFSLNQTLHKVSTLCGGSTRSRVSRTVLGKMQISIPSIKEQQKIAAVLTNADKKIELLEQQLTDLQQEKKALMQQLLTGKKRVKVD